MNKIYFVLLVAIIISCNATPKNNTEEAGKEKSLNSKDSQSFTSTFLLKHPLLTLMRKTPVEIGCILESEFNYRDPIFNCDNKTYVNKGDPANKTTEYYEGIKIPQKLIKKIHPTIKEINLEFEHGNLREIDITFEDSLMISKIREIFSLPSDLNNLPDNVVDIEYGENIFSKDKPANPNYTRWLSIIGFDHMGAGDVGGD